MTKTPRAPWGIGLVLFGLAAGLAAVFLGPRQALPTVRRAPAEQNVLRIVYTQDLQPDPHVRLFPLATYNQFVLSLWEPLVECEPATGEPRPAAAAGWAWSADRRVLTLRLRPEGRWSNGDRVTAHDFVRGWLRLLRSRLDTAYALFPLRNAEAYHRGLITDATAVGLRAVDSLTLEIELDQPRTSFVAELADPLLVPLHATTAQVLAERRVRREPAALITNGPFRLLTSDADGYRLAASATYHGRDGVRLSGLRFIRAGHFSGTLLLAAGAADLFPDVGLSPRRHWPTDRAVVTETESALAVEANYLNVTRGPLRDIRVRRALALAVNPDRLMTGLDQSRREPATSWVPDMPGRKGLVLMKTDVPEARRLLAEAGYPGGKGFPILRMMLPRRLEANPYPAACTEDWFHELGIRTYVTFETPERRYQRLMAGDYDIVHGQVVATVPDPVDLLTCFSMPPGLTECNWRDEETVRLLAAVNRQRGAERLETVEQIERRVLAAVPAIPLLFERRQTLRAAEVRGWYADPLARQSPRHLWLEPPAPRPART